MPEPSSEALEKRIDVGFQGLKGQGLIQVHGVHKECLVCRSSLCAY